MKAKQTKKAVKKQPVKKLIEGKYTHKYLVRLEKGEGEKLTELMNAINTKNYTTATIRAIEQHLNLCNTIEKQKRDIRELNSRIKKQSDLLYGLKVNLKGLFDMPLVDIGTEDNEEEKEDEFNEDEDLMYQKYKQTSILDYD